MFGEVGMLGVVIGGGRIMQNSRHESGESAERSGERSGERGKGRDGRSVSINSYDESYKPYESMNE